MLFALPACTDDDDYNGQDEELYVGEQRVIKLKKALNKFNKHDFVCRIMAQDGTVFTRKADHSRSGDESTLTLRNGLLTGKYTLLSLEYKTVTQEGDTADADFGLGCTVNIEAKSPARVMSAYDDEMGFYGSGTEEDPYKITSAYHLVHLASLVNSDATNEMVTAKTHFAQTGNIDMTKASNASERNHGWISIGSQCTNPFRGIYDGCGYTLSSLRANRPNSMGIALFGFVQKAFIKNVKLAKPHVEGKFAVGSLIGGTTVPGNSGDTVLISRCIVTDGNVKGADGSLGVGGIIGVVDKRGTLTVDSCAVNSSVVSGDYAVGGIVGVGAKESRINIAQCRNTADVTSCYTGAGGIVGSADSINVSGCENSGKIIGSTKYKESDSDNGGFGTGGIVGGAETSFIKFSSNKGEVEGYIGVGGIIGSTRVTESIFSNTLLRSCYNEGHIKGNTSVGGLCGEALFGSYQSYNKGTVEATGKGAVVGGIAGNTSVAVIHNTLNSGKVIASDSHCASGVVGKVTYGALFACQNYGDMDVKADYAGGLAGLAGNYTMVDYCSNFGFIHNSGSGPTGGLIGEIGDPRNWSASDIQSIIIGSIEIVMGIAGPMVAIGGAAFEEGTLLGELFEYLHIGEVITDIGLTGTDALLFIGSSIRMANEKEQKMMETAIKRHNEEVDAHVADNMKSIRNGYALSSGMLASGLNLDVYSNANSNMQKVLEFYAASDKNNEIINYNINNNREKRAGKLETEKRTNEIAHKVVSGVCILGATVAIVGGLAASWFSAGTSVVAGVTAFGAIMSVVGGANAVIEGANDFQYNVVVVSQCINMGKVKAENSDKVGGILGHAQQFCEINDCVNSGMAVSASTNSSGGLVGRADSKTQLNRCLNVGTNWRAATVGTMGTDIRENNLYVYDQVDKASTYRYISLSADQLCSLESYSNWDFSSSIPLWKVTKTKGYFPVPNHSQLETPIK